MLKSLQFDPCLLIILFCSTISCGKPVPAALEWPEITNESKPWSRWWWHGSSVTKEGITAELEAYEKAGLGGLELTPIYGVIGEEDDFIHYLSSEWMDMLEHTLQEADRLGLGLDMATGTGWPFGGPGVGESDGSKYLAHKIFKLNEGEMLTEPVVIIQHPLVRSVPNMVYQLYGIYKETGEPVTGSPGQPQFLSEIKRVEIDDLVEPIEANDNLQALALDQVRFPKQLPLISLMGFSDRGESIDLTEQVDDRNFLNWIAPAGNWVLYAIFQGWHGKMVERAAPGGEGYVIDHFSSTSITNYLERFDEAFEGRNVSSLRAFFNDSYEVDDAYGQSNWTPGFLEEFNRLRGYDIRQQLPALFGDDSADVNIRVLSDYRETISDLILEEFTDEWGEWARSRGAIIRNQAHGSPANILDLYAASEIPETEGTDIIRIKFASSAGNVAGKKLISSESATWLDEHFLSSLSDVKENIDRYFVGGVNHVLYHGTCYSPPGDDWPGRLFYAAIHANPRNSLWNAFPTLNKYIAHTQAFLQSGKPDNDILLYFPIYDRFATPGRELLEHFDGHGPELEGTSVEVVAGFLLSEGYTFDFISDRQIVELSANNGNLETSGGTYKAILLPECRFIPLETFEKLIKLALNGCQIIIYKSLPSSVPGLGNLNERREKYHELSSRVVFEEVTPDVQKASVGSGAFLTGENLNEIIMTCGMERETLVEEHLEFIRREYEDGKIYFISNWSGKDFEGWIPISSNAKSVAVYDPMHGKSGLAKSRVSENGGVEVYFQLPHGESWILKTSGSTIPGSNWNYYQQTEDQIMLRGSWSVEFVEGGPEIPASVKTDTLGSWTDFEGDSYKSFSGTVRYSLDFPDPGPSNHGYILDLGDVHESANVFLNEEHVGTMIGPSYQLFISPDQFIERNLLEIDVSNLMANRIADLDRRGVFWKKFYNVNFPARRRENRGQNGLFDASGWEPLPSGLVGPVKINKTVLLE
jgi:hypothetical protein